MSHTKAEGGPAGAQPGQLIAGKYRVGETLGRGGMGVVVCAVHTELGHKVAIKLLLVPELAQREALARFSREAQAAAKIHSYYVVQVHDIGRLEDGTPYMVMEHLDGRDLDQHLRANGALGIEEAALYLLQACDALAQAHALRIVHRDLKPANLFLARDRDGQARIKVLDFGISKFLPESHRQTDLTQTSSLMGSPRYMSPEQMQSAKSVGVQADVWALGVILYELLSGRPAFDGATLPEICSAVVLSQPPPLRQLRPEVPEPLTALTERCLQKAPNARPHTIAEVANALAPFAGPAGALVLSGITASQAGASGRQPPVESASAMPSSGAAPRTAPGWASPTSRNRSGGLAVLAGVAAIGGALWLARQAPGASEGETGSPSSAVSTSVEAARPAPEPPAVSPPPSSTPAQAPSVSLVASPPPNAEAPLSAELAHNPAATQAAPAARAHRSKGAAARRSTPPAERARNTRPETRGSAPEARRKVIAKRKAAVPAAPPTKSRRTQTSAPSPRPAPRRTRPAKRSPLPPLAPSPTRFPSPPNPLDIQLK